MKLLRLFTLVAVTAVIMLAAPWDVRVLGGQAPQANAPSIGGLTDTPQCNALDLNGSTAYARRTTPVYPLSSVLVSFTAEAWIYPTERPDFESWILSGDTWQLWLDYFPGQSNNGLGIGWSLHCTSACSASDVQYRDVALNQWNHVALSFNASTKVVRLAINGVVTSETITNTNFLSPSYFRVGTHHDQGPFFSGYIDEVRISDVARYGTAQFIPDSEFTVDASTRALYHFGEAPGATFFADSSPYTAILTGQGGAQTNLSPVCGLPTPTPLIFAGITGMANNGGWLSVRNNLVDGLTHRVWRQVPWAAYNAAGGAVHPAAGDIDGDGLDEIVLGLGPGGQGWMAVLDDAGHGFALLGWLQVPWAIYNANNGEVYPAVGDVTGDGTADIIAGLGPGGGGYFAIFNSILQQTPDWRQVNWPAYNAGAGSVHPAVGDVDNDGSPDLVLGLGAGSQGFLEIKGGAASGYSTKAWIQVPWAAYNAQNGTTYPAASLNKIAIGLGQGGQGFVEMRDGGFVQYAHATWVQVSWPVYNAAVGETHPALANLNAIAGPELVVGLAPFGSNGGWFEVINPVSGASLGWRNLDWAAYQSSGGGIFPAIGRSVP